MITEKSVCGILEEPGVEWPFYAGLVKNLAVLEGDASKPEKYYGLARRVPEEKFRRALKENLSELVFESSGRIFSCIARKRYEDIYCAVIETPLEMKTALCLLNCTHVNHDYFEGLQESFKFKNRQNDISLWQPDYGGAEVHSALQTTREISLKTISLS